jgi:transposase
MMRLHEEIGLSVSDDTIYRALKDLGFSHMSARPKAYKQDPDATEAFKRMARPVRKWLRHDILPRTRRFR